MVPKHSLRCAAGARSRVHAETTATPGKPRQVGLCGVLQRNGCILSPLSDWVAGGFALLDPLVKALGGHSRETLPRFAIWTD